MESNSTPNVVVGVDGSQSAMGALDWAIAEALVRHARLHVVHGFIWPLYRVKLGSSPYGPEEGGLRAAAGSVSRHLLHHAACPVAVIPTSRRADT